jgi:hypothetical protein
VQVPCEIAEQQGPSNSTSSEYEDLGRVRILCCETEWSRILVMQLVNVLVKWAVVECLMS